MGKYVMYYHVHRCPRCGMEYAHDRYQCRDAKYKALMFCWPCRNGLWPAKRPGKGQ